MEVRTRVLGEEHPDTLRSMNNLAITPYYMDDRDGAVRLLRKCLDGRIKKLGEEHPDTISTRKSLKVVEGN